MLDLVRGRRRFSGWAIQPEEPILGAGSIDACAAKLAMFPYTRILHEFLRMLLIGSNANSGAL